MKYTRNRNYRDFDFVDPEERTPKKAILIPDIKKKNILTRLFDKIKGK
jgi:hypothetical protein